MSLIRAAVVSLVAVSLLTVPIAAEGIQNWPAPSSWTPPAGAALEKKLQRHRTHGLIDEALPTGPLPFFGIAPCRLVDTRGNGFTGAYGPPPLAAGAPRSFTLTGRCGIPSAAQAVSLNVTVTNTQGNGFILIYPQGDAQPTVSTLNYVAGQTVANAAVVPLGIGGGITVVAGVSGTDLILDTNGYYAPASVATQKTVSVDCTKGPGIQSAIDRYEGPLLVQIHGICQENVSIHRRKDLTLRGTDPATDGIQGVANAGGFPALRIAYTDLSAIENLSISNGALGGMNVFFSRISVTNSRINGNAGQGIHANIGGSVFCLGCRLENNTGFAAGAFNGGFVTLNDSLVSGNRGLTASGNSYADLDCLNTDSAYPCSLNVTGRAVFAAGGATVALIGTGDFAGQIGAEDNGTAQLLGARQIATAQPGQGPAANGVHNFGMLLTTTDFGPTQLFGTTIVTGWGRALLSGTTTLAGTIDCNVPGDAFLESTVIAAPGASVVGCEHGALPPP